MKILPANAQGMEEALRVVRNGGLVVHATETCYGFACDLTNPDAVAKLFAIKQRPAHQPVSTLFFSVDEAKKWVAWNNRAEELAKEHLPGPLTIILPLRKDVIGKIFPTATVPTQTLGIRVSSHPVAQELAEEFGKPLSTTSANLHGEENPYSMEDLQKQFSDDAGSDFLLLDSGTLKKNPPSTVIDLSGDEQTFRRLGSTKP
ncbi:threonylcarbamoyl-AMP synthase [Candidatus Peribacteria bacterium RIFCSPHIGHO2_02_FULL_52_16]|nr:MAG: threonylcarbamoyl-AMP synthase [Candidatus Peribacteria bacterium RIFCSPHIGHO2_01_FULL_51_35]OGJ61972.1 MAG: threonylcarbamoyl-AMP synthase [Candidatus Peribacteria bacterium RIFCSPHIGHO2_02_FULL_52_16]